MPALQDNYPTNVEHLAEVTEVRSIGSCLLVNRPVVTKSVKKAGGEAKWFNKGGRR